MKKIFRFTLLLILPALTSFAQSTDPTFHFGMKICPNLAWLKTDTKGIESDGSLTRFSYGLITEFRIAENYAFATGIDISYRGGKLKGESSSVLNDTTTTIVSESSLKLQYIELPLTLKLKTNEIGHLRYYLQVGVAPGFNLRARADGKTTAQVRATGYQVNSSLEFEDEDVKDDINSINLSMVIGAGVEYNLSGTTNFFGGIVFNNGFTDVSDSKDAKYISNFLGLNLGVLF
jgi:opacity protein-like surface antigen